MKVRLGKQIAVWQRNDDPVAQLGVVAAFCVIGWIIDKIIDESDDVRAIQVVIDIARDALRHPFKTRPVDEHVLGEISRQ